MEYLRSSVNLRAYGQRDPLVEYKKEGLRLFQSLEISYATQVAQILPNLAARVEAPREQRAVFNAARSITAGASTSSPKKEYGRNDHVVITNGKEQKEMKYKKAEPLLATGWRIIQ